jgi:hypothetical protein
MRAYIAYLFNDDWQMLVHGETRGKAKSNFIKWNPESSDDDMWVLIRLRRLPEWDDKPFTDCQEMRQLFTPYEYNDKGDGIYNEPFTNDCLCELCRMGSQFGDPQ